jgi:hypothetical protein
MAESTEKASIAAAAVMPTQGQLSPLKDLPNVAGTDGYFDATPHHVKATVSTKPSFLQRLVSTPKASEGDEDYLADGCIVM